LSLKLIYFTYFQVFRKMMTRIKRR